MERTWESVVAECEKILGCPDHAESPLMSNLPNLIRDLKAAQGNLSGAFGGSTPFLEILKERQRQDQKWGEQNHHPYKWLAILGEEVGESNKAVLEGSLLEYRDEMVQVAAVAIAAIQCLERGKWSPGT